MPGSAPQPLPGDDARPGVFGSHAVDELPRVVRELGLDSLLLVTGRSSFVASGAADVLPELRAAATVHTWSDFSPNPRVEDLAAGAEMMRSVRPAGIVAIGGGSVLDMAKLLAVLGDLDADQIPEAVRSNAVTARSRPLVLVPTTSGSGSEATHFAVAYIGPDKYSVAHPALLPDFVILDPVLTESAGSYQKATSVIDAIAQAVESQWARGASDDSRGFSRAALQDLVAAAPAFVAGDTEAAVPAARGSHLAGRAIDLSKTTGAHALAYGLTHRHGISHGHAVATTLGAFARFHGAAAAHGQGHESLARDLDVIAGLIGAEHAQGVGDRLDAIAGQLGLELRLSALGVPRSDLEIMARSVNRERLGNNPAELSERDLSELLESCW